MDIHSAGFRNLDRTPAVKAHAQGEKEPEQAASDTFSKGEAPGQDELQTFTRKLKANPLFKEGANFDEFNLTAQNADFAQKQFKLDQTFVDLVKAGGISAKYSVVYHSEPDGVKVDAYRTAAQAGSDSVFTAYDIKNPDFDPSKVYRNELVTPMGEGKAFGSVITSKMLAVPATADPAMKEWLKSNGFELKETIPFEKFGYPREFKERFGIKDDLGIEKYELKNKSFLEKFKVFYSLFKDDPEYRVFKIGDTLTDVGSAMLLGVVTPKLWTQGAAYGIASTISSIGNIGSPAVSILGEGILGSVVDKAVNSDKPLENLKKVKLACAGLSAVNIGSYFALNPEIIGLFGAHKGKAFVGLYGLAALASGFSGVMSGKANFAIRDQLITKGTHSSPEIAKNFYQIMGVESSISEGVYLGSYTATMAAAGAFPNASLYIAGSGAALWAGSKFLFPLYQEKPEMKTTIEGGAYIHDGNRYIFDSGWEISFKGTEGKIVKEDEKHFSVSFEDGELYMKNADDKIAVEHKRRIKDYLPSFLKPKFLGEKEHWALSDGKETVDVSRYGSSPYHLREISPNEFVITKKEKPEAFWKEA
ncbi:MAG: hypothetical protein RDV48_23080 [Candidatus Eremiobacteraeota bacterium]|nr:hypothetical protein [Candidatus Eremiobacteraeota bacterium]